jgi:hypothetical protein
MVEIGGMPVLWHQDNGYTFVEPQQYLTCWVALTDATEANGCPWVAPGVHKLGTLAHRYVEPLGFECFDDPPETRRRGRQPAAARRLRWDRACRDVPPSLCPPVAASD